MDESNYELPIEKPVLYALASLCVATYVNGGIPETRYGFRGSRSDFCAWWARSERV